jgi:hypothetical protein
LLGLRKGLGAELARTSKLATLRLEVTEQSNRAYPVG